MASQCIVSPTPRLRQKLANLLCESCAGCQSYPFRTAANGLHLPTKLPGEECEFLAIWTSDSPHITHYIAVDQDVGGMA